MTTTVINGEPHVTLATGGVVHECVYDLVSDLLSTGHRIDVNPESGLVHVDPAIHEDLVDVLTLNWSSTQLVLDDLGWIVTLREKFKAALEATPECPLCGAPRSRRPTH